MDGNLFSRMFGFNQYCVKVNVQGLSHEDSLIQPQPGGNCLNWVLGHIVTWRNPILELLDESPIWSEEETEPYKQGSRQIKADDPVKKLEDIVADFNRSQDILVAALGRLSESDLQKEVKENQTLAQRLAFAHFHEAYHVGQTGLLRRIAGKEGAIQ